jgi:hypothetical protein
VREMIRLAGKAREIAAGLRRPLAWPPGAASQIQTFPSGIIRGFWDPPQLLADYWSSSSRKLWSAPIELLHHISYLAPLRLLRNKDMHMWCWKSRLQCLFIDNFNCLSFVWCVMMFRTEL